jgi:hypothetical protein
MYPNGFTVEIYLIINLTILIWYHKCYHVFYIDLVKNLKLVDFLKNKNHTIFWTEGVKSATVASYSCTFSSIHRLQFTL